MLCALRHATSERIDLRHDLQGRRLASEARAHRYDGGSESESAGAAASDRLLCGAAADLKRIEVKGRADGRSKGGGAAPASEAAPPGRIEVEIARSEVSPLVEAVLEYCRIVFDVLPATPASPTSPGLMVLATPDAADATANAATGPDLDDLMTLIPWEADTQALRPVRCLAPASIGSRTLTRSRIS